jgi:hypothetical protein
MESSKDPRPADATRSGRSDAGRWLSVGGGIALLLALFAVFLAWQRATDDRRSAEDVKARVAAEMNRIEAEANRMEREAAQ